MLQLHYNHPNYSDEQINASISGLLDSGLTLGMATVKAGQSYINTAHFAYNDFLRLYIFTSPGSEHGRNLAVNPSVAAAIWKQPQMWGAALEGIQLFGTCTMTWGTSLREAVRLFHQRFPGFERVVPCAEQIESGKSAMYFYAIKVKQAKILDEPRFGKRQWVTVTPLLEKRAA